MPKKHKKHKTWFDTTAQMFVTMNDTTVGRLRHRAAAIIAATLALVSVAAFAVAAALAADPSASPTSTEVPIDTTAGSSPQLLILGFIGAAVLGVIALILIRRAMRARGGGTG